MNRALRLEEASLRDPERIDRLARKLGMQSPQAGQVIRMDTSPADARRPGDGECCDLGGFGAVKNVEGGRLPVAVRISDGFTRMNTDQARNRKQRP